MPQDLEWWRDSSGSMKSTKSEMKAVGAERVYRGGPDRSDPDHHPVLCLDLAANPMEVDRGGVRFVGPDRVLSVLAARGPILP